jgi:uncharacterized repeat protein (TIGR03803 family)
MGVALLLGILFSGSARGGGLVVAASFKPGEAGNPFGGVTMDAAGDIYGTSGSSRTGGEVWEITQGSSYIRVVASLGGINGDAPLGGVALGPAGVIDGTAALGGSSGNGTVWEVGHGGGTVTALASFNGIGGSQPVSQPTFDSAGNLYGTTIAGGSKNAGTVWVIKAGSEVITTVASFTGSNGANPWAGVTIDPHGNLYGTTLHGGAYNQGTVWKIKAGSGTITTLATFNGSNGANPWGGVTFDALGNLYGTTAHGGASNDGSVWEIKAGGGTIKTLVSFDNQAAGMLPLGGVSVDSSGTLYGTASLGGAYNSGTVWELKDGSGPITVLASFAGYNGFEPIAGATFGTDGNLYGTTFAGGAWGFGTVWEFPLQLSPVPEPASLLLGLVGLASAGAIALLKPRPLA